VQRPHMRMSDVVKRLKFSKSRPELTNLVIIASSGSTMRRTKPFDVYRDGTTTLDRADGGEVFFIKEPRPGDVLKLAVVKEHSVEFNSIVGEARIGAANGFMRAKLFRKGQLTGILILDVTSALPTLQDEDCKGAQLERAETKTTMASTTLGDYQWPSFSTKSSPSSTWSSAAKPANQTRLSPRVATKTAGCMDSIHCMDFLRSLLGYSRRSVRCASRFEDSFRSK